MASASAGARAAGARAVQIFSTYIGCPDSTTAKEYLDSQGVLYEEHDCSSSGHEECGLMSMLVVRSILASSYRSATFRCADVPTLVESGTLPAKLLFAN